MLTKPQKIKAKRTIRYLAYFLAPISALLTPLVEFQFITNNVIKWIIYSVLVVSISINSLPNLLNLIPERARHKQLRDTIINGLDIICSILNLQNPAKYRACIFMLRDPKSNAITIKYNSSNMDDAQDLEIKLEKFQGCTGTAWAKGKPVISDLTIKRRDGDAQWGLTEEQIELTKGLTAILSVPIFRPKSSIIIAILSIDSKDRVAKYFLKPSTKVLAASYASIFANLLQANDEPYPLRMKAA